MRSDRVAYAGETGKETILDPLCEDARTAAPVAQAPAVLFGCAGGPEFFGDRNFAAASNVPCIPCIKTEKHGMARAKRKGRTMMVGDNGLTMLLQLVVGAAVLFTLAAVGTWLVLRFYPSFGEKESLPMPERSEDRRALGEELWGDEGGAGEMINRKAA
jgi:hypothetical protein